MGTICLVVSATFLILAFITRYILFEFIAIVSFFLGVILIFSSIERYMKENVGNEALTPLLIALNELMEHHSIQGNAMFLPPLNDVDLKTFLPLHDDIPLPSFESLSEHGLVIPNQGLLLPSTGSGLLRLYEEEIGAFQSMTFEYLLEWLPRVLTSGLKLCENAEIIVNGEEVQVRLLVSLFRHLCQHEETRRACRRLGCPLASSIACAFAKNQHRAVRYKQCNYNPEKREATILYELLPTIKTE
jgi:hypothetical protein